MGVIMACSFFFFGVGVVVVVNLTAVERLKMLPAGGIF